ncbi:hypothetical protein DFAR_3460049 [Desulfarculales bacterium]
MKSNYRAFFAITREPFDSDLAPKEIMQITEVLSVAKRFDYAIRLVAQALVTGNMGSGKPTALRWAASRQHPSAYQIILVSASQGSILELTGKSASSSKWTPLASPGPSLPSSSENRSWRLPRTARKDPPSSSMKSPSSSFKPWPSCTSLLNFRDTPSQSCPLS